MRKLPLFLLGTVVGFGIFFAIRELANLNLEVGPQIVSYDYIKSRYVSITGAMTCEPSESSNILNRFSQLYDGIGAIDYFCDEGGAFTGFTFESTSEFSGLVHGSLQEPGVWVFDVYLMLDKSLFDRFVPSFRSLVIDRGEDYILVDGFRHEVSRHTKD